MSRQDDLGRTICPDCRAILAIEPEPESDFICKLKRAALHRAMYYGTRYCHELFTVCTKVRQTLPAAHPQWDDVRELRDEALDGLLRLRP